MGFKKNVCGYFMAFLFLTSPGMALGQFEYFHSTPDFEFSESGKYGTGLGIADMNNDGWQDIVIANGNDIERKKVEIYYNNGDGTFDVEPGWESNDIDYHGHLAIGDLDKNGWNDIVVSVYIGETGFSSPGKIKVYYNSEGGIEATPSFVSEEFYSFSCALGDADNDGDLDIAAAAGESYSNIYDHARIFLNDNGIFTDTASWKSSNVACSYDTDFADFNRDGFMDVVFGNSGGFQSKIYTSNSSGMVSNTATWENSGTNLLVNSLDVGCINENSYPDVVFTNNGQLGGDGKIKGFFFDQDDLPASSAPSWESDPYDYLSGIYLYDVDSDGYKDLIFGGWWEPVRICYGNSTGFEEPPVFSTSQTSVVEAIVFSDLDKEALTTFYDTTLVTQDSASVFYVSKKPAENILSVRINSNILLAEDYCFVPGKNWVSLTHNALQDDTVIIEYTHSSYCDMVISNWDVKNFIYYNQGEDTTNNLLPIRKENNIRLYPNPAKDFINIELPGSLKKALVEILDVKSGTVLKKVNLFENTTKIGLAGFKSGIYVFRVWKDRTFLDKKVVVY